MHIIFYGQLGLSQLHDKDASTAENRVEAIARHLVQEGHAVTVLGTTPYLASGNYHGIELQKIPSLNPEKPGGWFYLALGLVYILWHKPDVIHVHTTRAALLVALAAWFLRDTRVVWTIDALPTSRVQKWLLKPLTYKLQPSLTTPLRTLQYRLLVEDGVQATYIPDGYHEPIISPIASARFGLRKEQYSVALVTSLAAARFVAKAYTATKTRKKIIVIGLEKSQVMRLRKQFPLVSLVTGDSLLVTSRIRRSLIASAAAVIIGDDTVAQTVLLETMHYERVVVALNDPRYQETLGLTARFVAPGDSVGLTKAIQAATATSSVAKKRAVAAGIRAQHHFLWPRVIEDYETLYAPHVRAVLIDSIQARPLVQRVNPRVQYS